MVGLLYDASTKRRSEGIKHLIKDYLQRLVVDNTQVSEKFGFYHIKYAQTNTNGKTAMIKAQAISPPYLSKAKCVKVAKNPSAASVLRDNAVQVIVDGDRQTSLARQYCCSRLEEKNTQNSHKKNRIMKQINLTSRLFKIGQRDG